MDKAGKLRLHTVCNIKNPKKAESRLLGLVQFRVPSAKSMFECAHIGCLIYTLSLAFSLIVRGHASSGPTRKCNGTQIHFIASF